MSKNYVNNISSGLPKSSETSVLVVATTGCKYSEWQLARQQIGSETIYAPHSGIVEVAIVDFKEDAGKLYITDVWEKIANPSVSVGPSISQALATNDMSTMLVRGHTNSKSVAQEALEILSTKPSISAFSADFHMCALQLEANPALRFKEDLCDATGRIDTQYALRSSNIPTQAVPIYDILGVSRQVLSRTYPEVEKFTLDASYATLFAHGQVHPLTLPTQDSADAYLHPEQALTERIFKMLTPECAAKIVSLNKRDLRDVNESIRMTHRAIHKAAKAAEVMYALKRLQSI